MNCGLDVQGLSGRGAGWSPETSCRPGKGFTGLSSSLLPPSVHIAALCPLLRPVPDSPDRLEKAGVSSSTSD